MESRIILRTICVAIGTSHLALLGFCLYDRIWELIEQAEPFLLGDHVFISTSYIVQILTVASLLLGGITEKLTLTIPWILTCAVLFSFGTIYAVSSVGSDESGQTFINFIVVVVVWAAWYMVLKYNLNHNEFISSNPNYIRKYRKIPNTNDGLD